MNPKQEPVELSLAVLPEKIQAERKLFLKSLTDFRRAAAWEVHRWPIDKCPVAANGKSGCKLFFPKSYLSRAGEENRFVRDGDDLNQEVYKYYIQNTVAPGVNYVHADGVLSKRHELLGPGPRVAGYFYDIYGDIHIRWWDSFLNEQWCRREKYLFDAELDVNGEWVEKTHAN